MPTILRIRTSTTKQASVSLPKGKNRTALGTGRTKGHKGRKGHKGLSFCPLCPFCPLRPCFGFSAAQAPGGYDLPAVLFLRRPPLQLIPTRRPRPQSNVRSGFSRGHASVCLF